MVPVIVVVFIFLASTNMFTVPCASVGNWIVMLGVSVVFADSGIVMLIFPSYTKWKVSLAVVLLYYGYSLIPA